MYLCDLLSRANIELPPDMNLYEQDDEGLWNEWFSWEQQGLWQKHSPKPPVHYTITSVKRLFAAPPKGALRHARAKCKCNCYPSATLSSVPNVDLLCPQCLHRCTGVIVQIFCCDRHCLPPSSFFPSVRVELRRTRGTEAFI
eukprot:GHVU01095061.1.p1 GENE.GHVU01095061.1~~GHVU01095061.1.p1  ORF type:complete len:142 (-),score=7.67 GHVU01095061.1:41-466(-)